MWEVVVSQEAKKPYFSPDKIRGCFERVEDATEFGRMIMKGFKDVTVTISYEETNVPVEPVEGNTATKEESEGK